MEAPEEVTLIYRKVGATHVFTAEGFPGFHIGSSRLATAYKEALGALGEHVALVRGCDPVVYDAIPLEQLRRELNAADQQ